MGDFIPNENFKGVRSIPIDNGSKFPSKKVFPGQENEFQLAEDGYFKYEYTVINGKIYIDGEPLNIAKASFIITTSGELRIGSGHYFLANNDKNVDLLLAGEISVLDGQALIVNNKSGHYRFPKQWADEHWNSVLNEYGNGIDFSKAKMENIDF